MNCTFITTWLEDKFALPYSDLLTPIKASFRVNPALKTGTGQDSCPQRRPARPRIQDVTLVDRPLSTGPIKRPLWDGGTCPDIKWTMAGGVETGTFSSSTVQMESLFGSLPEMLDFQRVFLQTLEERIASSPDFSTLETPSQFKVRRTRRNASHY